MNIFPYQQTRCPPTVRPLCYLFFAFLDPYAATAGPLRLSRRLGEFFPIPAPIYADNYSAIVRPHPEYCSQISNTRTIYPKQQQKVHKGGVGGGGFRTPPIRRKMYWVGGEKREKKKEKGKNQAKIGKIRLKIERGENRRKSSNWLKIVTNG